MPKTEVNPKVDAIVKKARRWQKEYEKLREIVLGCQLKEELKWGAPCYTLQGKNIVLIHGFKNYCALLFFKGALLKDAKRILIKQTANVQAGRQIRFTSVQEITKSETTLRAYIKEAMAAETAGLKVRFKKPSELAVPEELQNKMEKMPVFRTAFQALTPGRQKAYILYISGAKQSKTRESRIEKYLEQILAGKGMDD